MNTQHTEKSQLLQAADIATSKMVSRVDPDQVARQFAGTVSQSVGVTGTGSEQFRDLLTFAYMAGVEGGQARTIDQSLGNGKGVSCEAV